MNNRPLRFQASDAAKASSSQDSDRWLGVDECIVERQRRLTPFNDWSPKFLFLTDPPHLMWSDGRSIPVEDVVGDHDWEPLIEVILIVQLSQIDILQATQSQG